MLTLGSLFDGIGGFPLAGVMCGIRPVWSSEIEPFPLKVTAARFPGVIQLGSVTDIDGGAVKPVDIITFGSPCQDLSVAGKQLGIHEGQRSNLFFEAVRIIKEMRAADERIGRTGKHIRPRFAVWENVPGAFISNKGADFKAVLEALAGVREDGVDVPQPKKWNTGGVSWETVGALPGGSTMLNTGECPSVARESTLSQILQANAPRKYYLSAKACAGILRRAEKRGKELPPMPAGGAGGSGGGGIAAFMGGQGAKARSIAWADDGTTPTLRAAESGSNQVPDVCYQAMARALTARHDSSPCVDRGQNVVALAWANSGNAGLSDGEVAPTIKAARNGEPAIMAFCAGGGKAREYDGHYGSISPTIRANAANTRPAVCVGNGQLHQTDMGDETGALNCMHDQQAVVYPGVQITSKVNRSNPKPGAPAPTLTNDSRHLLVADGHLTRKYIVRRLTPTECARLQGFPDEWCEGLGGSDSAIYKAYGNGLALPCTYDVMQRIARFVEREAAPNGA